MPCKDLPDNTLWLAVTNPDGNRPHHFFWFNVIHAGTLSIMFFVHVYLCTNSKCCALVCLFDCLNSGTKQTCLNNHRFYVCRSPSSYLVRPRSVNSNSFSVSSLPHRVKLDCLPSQSSLPGFGDRIRNIVGSVYLALLVWCRTWG